MRNTALICCLTALGSGCARNPSVGAGKAPVDSQQATPAATAPLDESASKAAAEILSNSIGMKLKRIPAGEFLMGSPDAAEDARDDERPPHRVRITRRFYLGLYEVTQAEYEAVMGANSCFFSPNGPGKDKVAGLNTPRFPAEQVTWHKAVEFCGRLTEMPAEKAARRRYRLPTEAEWEYACRAGTTSAFHCGESLSAEQANFNGNYPYGGAPKGQFLVRTTEVGSYEPNAFGLYDMHGNVWEWCADWFGADYYRQAPVEDPQGPTSGSSRVIRGGDWYSDARDCRSAYRNAEIPDGIFYAMGFRVLMTSGDNGQSLAADSLELAAKRSSPTPQELLPPVEPPDRPLESAAGEDWPGWRGPRGDGTWQAPPLPPRWPDTGLHRRWRQPVGGGYGGVAVADGRLYVMDRQPPPDEIERVLALDALDGRLLWSHSHPVKYDNVSYGNGPRCTPTVREGSVYTLGATGQLCCLDAVSGQVRWSHDLVGTHRARVPIWGFSASPLVFENLVIVHVAADPDGCLLALDRQSGSEVWRSLPDQAGYATPILIDHGGTAELIAWTPSSVHGLDPRTGAVFWTVPFEVTYGTSIATPIFQEGIVLVSNYYDGTKAIQLSEDPTKVEVLWEDRRNLRGLMSPPLCREGHVYLLDKRHGLTCFELRTGKKLWDDGNRMTPKGRNPQATLVWSGDGDRALILNSEGELILARLNPTGYHEESRTRIIGPTWAHPAYAGGCVYARSDEELVCVSLVGEVP